MEEGDREEKQDPSVRIWSVREEVTNSIREKLSKLPPSHSTNCIYTVPERLRKVNPDAFTPRLVSIGPLHHGKRQLHDAGGNKLTYKPQLQAMEEYKLRYLKSFFDRKPDILPIIDSIVRNEATLRRYYQDKIDLNGKEFSELILVDSIFMVELLSKNCLNDPVKNKDEIFYKKWMSGDLMHDMILIENQIPLSIPLAIFNQLPENKNKKFGDALYNYLLKLENIPDNSKEAFSSISVSKHPPHLVDCLRMAHVPPRNKGTSLSTFKKARPATELLEAGVKFSRKNGGKLVEIDFKDGVLSIPPLKVNEWTETFFRNIIAFEQCERMSPRYISDYIVFMDHLIDTADDVQVLKDNSIIVVNETGLNGNEEVANLFNNLFKETVVDESDFYFADISNSLNEYSRDCLHRTKAKIFKWRVMLEHTYFNSPWSFISLVAAVVLLILTVVQTACSVIGLY
ncbi:hypothetical protein NMG60_11027369 [Bertholletia excelsa]